MARKKVTSAPALADWSAVDSALREIRECQHTLAEMSVQRDRQIDSIKADYTQQKKLAAAISRAASNIHQICRRINSAGRFYAEDVAELKERQIEIWSLLKETQKKEL